MAIYKQYLNPNISAQNIYGLNLTVKKRQNDIMHTHNYYEFMLVKTGKILHKHQCGENILNERQLCFIRPEDVHQVSSYSNEATSIYNIGITQKLLDKVFEFYDFDSTYIISSKEPIVVTLSANNFDNLCAKIDNFAASDFGEQHSKLFYNLLSEFLFLITSPQSFDCNYLPNTPNWLLKIIKEMQQPDNFIKGLPKLLSITTYSQEYISRCFKKYLNLTPTQYINSLRLKYAKKLILDDNVPISEACYACGFNCEGYFYKEFKKMFSMTPNQMKKYKDSVI